MPNMFLAIILCNVFCTLSLTVYSFTLLSNTNVAKVVHSDRRSTLLNYSFRNAQVEDLRGIATLCAEVFDGPFNWMNSWKRTQGVERFNNELTERYTKNIVGGKKHSMVIALDQQKIVGFLEVGCLPSPILVDMEWEGETVQVRPEVLYLGNVAVDENFRRKGIATKLLKIGYKIAEKLEEPILFVCVECDNLAAIKMYQREGFTVALDETQLIDKPMKRDRKDRIYMQKSIEISTPSNYGTNIEVDGTAESSQ